MRCPSPYWWILLEPPGTPRILLDVPHPQYLKCMAALVCRPPPFHTFYSHALGCVGMRCHSPYSWKLLEPPGTLVCRSPPFHTFYSHALGCAGICCHSPYYWKLLEPPGTYTTLGFSWMCPTPSTWNVWLHWCAGPPPFIHFIPMLWAVLACVAILPTTGNYWNHLELLGFSWMCPTPNTWNVWLHWCAGPPPFIHFIPMLWAVLACVAILPTTGNYWNHLELLRFSWMCLTPSTWNVWLHWCAGPPPFHTFYSHALGCVGMRCHSPYYWKLLEPPGTP